LTARAGGVEVDLGALQLRRAELIAGRRSVEMVALSLLCRWIDDQDPDGAVLRQAAANPIASVTPGEQLGEHAQALLAECESVLAEPSPNKVLSRFAPGVQPLVACEPGWYGMVVRLADDIERAAPGTEYVSIKQKFGHLEVDYLRPAKPEQATAVGEQVGSAREASLLTCEACGLPGVLRDDCLPWRTLCDVHTVEAWR